MKTLVSFLFSAMAIMVIVLGVKLAFISLAYIGLTIGFAAFGMLLLVESFELANFELCNE